MAPPKKSDDSKLSDAAKAVEENRLHPGGEDNPLKLPELLQDAAAQAKASGASQEQVERIEKLLAGLTSLVETQNKKIIELESRDSAKVETVSPARYVVCPTCGQGMKSCKGQHKTIRVLVANPVNLRAFPGITRNGVKYFGYAIVPAYMADEILAAVNHWERGEAMLEQNYGRVMDAGTQMQRAERNKPNGGNLDII